MAVAGSSFFRRMPTGEHPVAPHCQRIRVVAQVQCRHRGSTCRRQTKNSEPVVTPAEMLVPVLRSGVEEGRLFPADRINSTYSIAFVVIAQRTAQPEVCFFGQPTPGPWQKVFDLEAAQD